MAGIHQDHAGDLGWVAGREGADDVTTQRMADEQVKRRDAARRQPRLKVSQPALK
jgi:hypothetical protein